MGATVPGTLRKDTGKPATSGRKCGQPGSARNSGGKRSRNGRRNGEKVRQEAQAYIYGRTEEAERKALEDRAAGRETFRLRQEQKAEAWNRRNRGPAGSGGGKRRQHLPDLKNRQNGDPAPWKTPAELAPGAAAPGFRGSSDCLLCDPPPALAGFWPAGSHREHSGDPG